MKLICRTATFWVHTRWPRGLRVAVIVRPLDDRAVFRLHLPEDGTAIQWHRVAE